MNNKLLIANLKMHFNSKQIDYWCHKFVTNLKITEGIIICPPSIHIYQVSEFFRNRGIKIPIGAQKAVSLVEGPLTGEISITMLSGLVDYLLIGHSEQRAFNNLSDKEIAKLIITCLNMGIVPILCVGDSSEQKKQGIDNKIIENQIKSVIESISSQQAKKMIVAYEPIWAIGSGLTPTNQQIDAKFQVISEILTNKISEKGYVFANILYGGSVNSANIQHLNKISNLRGYLVGSASLDAEEFAKMASLL